VVFVREFVPRCLVAWLARLLYNEPYRAAPLEATIRDDDAGVSAEYRLQWAGRMHTIRVQGKKPAFRPEEASTEHFFKEHRWGFGVTRRGQGVRYEVVHPAWDIYPVQDYHIELDWGAVYGLEWAFLGRERPDSTVFALGSDVAVYPKGQLLLKDFT